MFPGPAQPFDAVPAASGIAAYDLDGDDRLEIVGLEFEDVHIARRNADGSYSRTSLGIRRATGSAVADVDRDGFMDLVVAAYPGYEALGEITVLFGTASGAFEKVRVEATAPGTASIAIGEVTGDCHPDLVLANAGFIRFTQIIPGSIDLIEGLGNRKFAPARVVGPQAYGVAVGDLDGDGWTDIVGHDEHSIFTLRSAKGSQFGPAIPVNARTLISVLDVDGDDTLDLVTEAGVQLGTGDGTFAAAASNAIRGVPVGDIDGDGKLDFVEGTRPSIVHFGNADGTAHRTIVVEEGGTTAGDFDGDNRVDLATAQVLVPQECPP